MNEMITWLRAQLDTDEQMARAALRDPRYLVDGGATADDGIWHTGEHPHDECGVEGAGIRIYDEGGHTAEQARHIANNDPARVLRQVQAHRAILTAYEFAEDSPPPSPLLSHARGQNNGYRQGLREAVKALVSIYSDRAAVGPLDVAVRAFRDLVATDVWLGGAVDRDGYKEEWSA